MAKETTKAQDELEALRRENAELKEAKAESDGRVKLAEESTKSKYDQIKDLYQKGSSHYQIAAEVYEFVNEDTLQRVASVVNAEALKRAEKYEDKED